MRNTNDPPMLGTDVPWEMIEKEFCRANHFAPFGKVEGGKVKDTPRATPYAVLRIESAKLPGEALLPVRHRVDFCNLWHVFEERGITDQEEVLVSYVPFGKKGLRKLLSSILPKLHIYVYPKGHLELIHDPLLRPDGLLTRPDDFFTFWRPIAQWGPDENLTRWGYR